MLAEGLNQASRTFQYDYIFIDAFFLCIWVAILGFNGKWKALKAGVIISILVYLIDAVFWWNIPAGTSYPQGTYIREYFIGGIRMPRPLEEYFWIKFGADFMMTISYSLFAFGWLWIMFENLENPNYNEIFGYTAVYFSSWMIIPFLSLLLPFNDTIVFAIRYMDTQMIIWFVNVLIGYSILMLIYATDIFNKKRPKIIGYVFLLGCLESFFMEFPLYLSGIRPTGVSFLIYEIFFLFNQGAPYLYIIYDIVLPKAKEIYQKARLKS